MPQALFAAAAVQFLSQIYKFCKSALITRRLNWSLLGSTGGMPSSHSAFVSALTTWIGLADGFSTPAFSVAAVFSCIVMFDSFKLRGQVQKHARIIEHIVSTMPGDQRPHTDLNLHIGHSPLEVLGGLVTGIGGAAMLYFIFG